MPDFNVHTCHSCHTKFQQWLFSRKHHCRSMLFISFEKCKISFFILECGNAFCSSCTNYYKLIPSLNLTRPIRVCRDSYPTIEPSPPTTAKSATPMLIQMVVDNQMKH